MRATVARAAETVRRPHAARGNRPVPPHIRPMTRTDVIIVGGGMTGLALACALGSAGVHALMLDRRPREALADAAFDGRTTAVALAARRFLEALDVWRRVEAEAEPILDIEVGERFSRRRVRYDHRDAGGEPMGHIVPNGTLRRALLERAAELPTVAIRAPAEVDAVEHDAASARVRLGGGETVEAPLVAASDGRGSRLRKAAGIRVVTHDYRQTGIVCTLGIERPHGGLAVERFFPKGPCAVLPMTGNRVSIVWALDADLAAGVVPLDDEDFLEELGERIGDRFGRLRLLGPRHHFPLGLVWAQRVTAERLALVGDAAHALHPIAGQGWNLAVRDVAALAEVVTAALRRGDDPGGAGALAAYARWRRFDSLALVGVTHGLTRLFGNDVLPLRLARDLGLGVVDRLGPLKRVFMRQAMGELGDRPRLMRGMPLRPIGGA